MTTKLVARVSDAKGASVFGMPGGRVLGRLPYGMTVPLAGEGMRIRGVVWFPVQVDMTIVWASEAGFAILKERP